MRMGAEDLIDVKSPSPFGVDAHHFGPAAGGHVEHALAEQPVDADDNDAARSDGVDERRLHARRPGTGDGKG
jgi:hypothetical protein